MKKLIYCAAALATALFAGSCQQEMLDTPATENTVTYTVELPDVQTKAIGDAGNVDQLIYEVWKTELPNERDLNNPAKATRLYQKSEPILNGRTIITVNLVQDQDYTILFWAQKENGGIYATNDLTRVSYTKGLNGGENGYKSNDENHAAFYGIDFIENNDNNRKSKTVILKRPFAQLNIASLNTSTEYGVEVLQSKVVVANVGTVFNVAQNYVATPEDNRTQIAVGGASEVTFDYANDPSGDNEYLYINGKRSEYEHVAMNYLFATGNNVTVSYEIYTKLTGKDAHNNGTVTYATVSNTVYEVPLQENYRTNIIGNLLTSTTEYTVEIDQNFVNPDYVIGDEWSQAGDYNYTVNPGASPVALKEILEHADAAAKANIANKSAVEGPVVTINLSENVEWETGAGIGSTPLLPENSPISAVVINGNGKTFTATGKGVGTIRLANGALLTFNNVKVVDKSVSYAEGNWEYGYLEFAGKLKFDNCQFVNAVMMQAENAAFVNCSFNSNHDNEYAVWVSKGNVTFTGSTFAGARGLKVHEAYGSNVVAVSVDGCTFDQISKKPGIALGDLDARTSVTVKNSTFDRCQAGDQQTYMYETDTDVTTFTFVSENNIVIPCDDTVLPQGDGSVVVSTSAGLKAAIESAGNQEVLTIKLANGTYTGAFDIPTKLVKIVALNRHQAVIDGLVHGLNSSHITLEGIVLTNANPVASESARHKADYYCLGAYAAAFVIEDCIFNVNNQGNAAGKGAINIGDGFNAYSASDEFELIVKNTVFNCNGERPIRAKTSSWIEGCTFVDQHRYAIQVQGNNQAATEKVIFKNNTISQPCNTSREPYYAAVSISKSQLIEDAAFTIEGNTVGAKFVYDNVDNVNITTCTLNGELISPRQCVTLDEEANEVLLSWDPNYYYVASTSDLKTALSAVTAGDNIKLLAASYKLDTYKAGVKLEGVNKNTVIVDAKNKAYGVHGNVNIENVTLQFANANYTGFQHTTTEVYTNCNIEGQPFLYGENVTFEGCTFTQTSSDLYNVWTYGAKNVTFNNCVLNSAGKSVLVYTESGSGSVVTLNNSTLNASVPVEGKAAIEIDASLVEKYVVNVNNTTANGFAEGSVSKNTLWNIKKGENKAEVYVDNVLVGGYKVEGDATYVTSTGTLTAALDAKAQNIVLMPGKYNGVFAIKANGTTITGTQGAVVDCINLNGKDNVTIQNVEFDAAGATYGYDGAGNQKVYAFSNIITGDNVNKPNKGAHNLVIDGCKFVGAFANPGAPIAFTDQKRGSGFSGNITIKNCVFENTNANYTIYAYYTGDSLNGHGEFVIENNTFNSACYAGPIYLGKYASNVPVVVTGNTFNTVTSIDYAINVQDHSSYGVSYDDTAGNTFAE